MTTTNRDEQPLSMEEIGSDWAIQQTREHDWTLQVARSIYDDSLTAHDESVRAEARAEAERRVSSAVNATLTAARIAREVRETFTAPAELTSGPVNADDVASAVADFIEGMGK